MAHGFLTLERWRNRKWIAVAHFNANQSASDALAVLNERGQAGFYRIVQTQRMIWAEHDGGAGGGKLRLRKWHVGSPDELARTAAAFDHDKGKWPVKRAAAELAARTAAARDRRTPRPGG
jgi:hypothetical protein